MNVLLQLLRARAIGHIARSSIAIAMLSSAAGHALGADPASVRISAADPSEVSAAWQAAEDAYDKQHFAAALAAFEQIAAGGDTRAAERAGQMLFYGSRLYGSAVPQDAQRAAVWLAQAARGGSDVAQLLLDRLPAEARPPVVSSTVGTIAEPPYVPGPGGC